MFLKIRNIMKIQHYSIFTRLKRTTIISTVTLLALSISNFMGIDSDFAKPVFGKCNTIVSGPLSQNRQLMNVATFSFLYGFYKQ